MDLLSSQAIPIGRTCFIRSISLSVRRFTVRHAGIAGLFHMPAARSTHWPLRGLPPGTEKLPDALVRIFLLSCAEFCVIMHNYIIILTVSGNILVIFTPCVLHCFL